MIDDCRFVAGVVGTCFPEIQDGGLLGVDTRGLYHAGVTHNFRRFGLVRNLLIVSFY